MAPRAALLVSAIACAVLSLLALAGARPQSRPPSFPPSAAQARRLLATLTVAPDRDGRTYRRDAFGPRTEGLAGPRIRRDPYTGKDPGAWIETDHVVPLGDAWRSGAAHWPPGERARFAGDGDNLLAVGGQANQDKGARTPDQWRPRRAFWCEYARRWTAIKARYGLHVTAAERRALTGMLAICVE